MSDDMTHTAGVLGARRVKERAGRGGMWVGSGRLGR